MGSRRSPGFTLIELMIVVTVIALLSAVAYSNYSEHVRKGRRAEARAALAELLQQQERYMTQRNCYLGFTNTGGVVAATAPFPSGACGGATPAGVPFKTFAGNGSAISASYWLSARECRNPGGGVLSTADCIELAAEPVRADPDAGVLRMTTAGGKSCDGTKAQEPRYCWP